MADENTPEIIRDCRARLRQERTLGDDDFEQLYRWARANDSHLLEELHRKPETLSCLQLHAEAAWPCAAALDDTVFWTTEALLCGGLTREQVEWVESFTAHGDAARRFDLYQDLADQLRPTYGYGNTFPPQRDGWVYLLTDAGQAAFDNWEPKAAIPFFEEAWESRDALRSRHKMTAKAIAHIATGYASAVVHLKDKDVREEYFDVALNRLEEGRQRLLAHVPDAELALEVLNIGIACGEAWRNRREKCKKNKVGWITSAERRLEHFREAECDVRAARGEAMTYFQPGSYDYASLPGSAQPAAARFLLDVAGAAEIYGNVQLAADCARKAGTISQRPHHRLKVHLQLARLELDRTTRMQNYEELLRDIQGGALDLCSPPKRFSIRKQIADASRDLSKTLERLERPTAAWFWSQQRAKFDPRSSSPTGGHAKAKPTAPSAKRKARKLKNIVRDEHVLGLVQTLMELARDYPQDATLHTSDILDQLAAVDDWRPAYRRCRDHLPLSECRSASDVARVCAEVADEFAQGYAPLYRPELLLALARNPSLDPQQRQAVAEEACDASLKVGRSKEAIEAQLELISLRLGTGADERVGESVIRVRDIVYTTLANARGTADLIDIAHGLTTTSANLAGMLAEHDCHKLAFKIAHAPLGALSRAFEQDPDLVEEYELAERRHAQHSENADQRLLELLRNRVLAGKNTYRPVASPELASVAACFGHAVTFVQLLYTPQHGTWALGAHVTGSRQCQYWSRQLSETVNILDLRKAIWDYLNPIHRNRPHIGTYLTMLHDAVMKPWLEKVKGSDALILIPHGNFSGLPLHAAHGPDGYLIQKCPVGYLSNLNDAPSDLVASPSALLGGWDQGIRAGDEVQELEARLQRLDVAVVRPTDAQQGKDHLLDPDPTAPIWGLVHVAAYGQLRQWPESSDSQLLLVDGAEGTAVTAKAWLHSGCRASLVFLNACEIGQGAVHHAGDLNGFPLALRARGTAADLSTVSLVNPGDAHRFAIAFYDELPKSDSLTAYRQACLKAVWMDNPACAWVPYVHSGFPVRMTSSHAPQS
ncbi:CHAT domain-containing protein [Streptomyces sp. NPDC054841]